jgi:hypothetical protein
MSIYHSDDILSLSSNFNCPKTVVQTRMYFERTECSVTFSVRNIIQAKVRVSTVTELRIFEFQDNLYLTWNIRAIHAPSSKSYSLM